MVSKPHSALFVEVLIQLVDCHPQQLVFCRYETMLILRPDLDDESRYTSHPSSHLSMQLI